MADDWSMGEVVRRLDRMEQLLLKVVSQDVYETTQRLLDHRFVELEQDLKQERDDRKAAIAEEREARKAEVKAVHDRFDKAGTNWRQTLFNGLLPGLFLLVTTAINVLLAFRIK